MGPFFSHTKNRNKKYVSSIKTISKSSNNQVNFDDFQIIRAIGKGSFGKVCIVEKKDSSQLYAMKYVSKAQAQAKDALENIIRERDILSSLDHPFLVNLWFSFQDEEDLFLVTDLLIGGDLRYHLIQGVLFPENCVRLFALELGSAIDYLHQRNIIHRDIKLDNILLDKDGHAHLTDFNIAIILEPGQLATSLSGTKPYMAPEMFACAANECVGYGPQVDWWALGICLWEILSGGQRPYPIHSISTLEEIQKMYNKPLQFCGSLQTLDSSTQQLIKKLLSRRPELRLSSFQQMYTNVNHLFKELKEMNLEECLLKKLIKPEFKPPDDHLNCDPTFELEEMIVEEKPLHKKHKRLAKQRSLKEFQTNLPSPYFLGKHDNQEVPSTSPINSEEFISKFRYFNRGLDFGKNQV